MQKARQPAPAGERRNPADTAPFAQHRTVTIMPFADEEEERLWDEIAMRRTR